MEVSAHPMDKFCGSKFWDSNLTWHTTDPDFTKCFEKTALVWAPCAFFWVFALLDYYYIRMSLNKDIPWNKLNKSKLILTAALLLLSIIDSIAKQLNPVDLWTPLIKAATFLLLLIFIPLDRKYGVQTSGCQFLFWFFLVICSIPRCRTELRERAGEAPGMSDYEYVSFMTFFALSCAMLILSCFADALPRWTKYTRTDNEMPECSASFLSHITYVWFDKMAWKGYRRPLEEKDLWNLRPQDSCKEVMPTFTYYWNQNVRKCYKKEPTKTKAQYSNGKVIFESPQGAKNAPQKSLASILPPIMKSFGGVFLFGSTLKLITDVLTFAQPQVLKLIINFVEHISDDDKERQPQWKGILYAVLLFVVAGAQSFITGQYFHRMFVVALRMRTALINIIYRKAMVISNATRKESTVGEIVNLMALDAQRVVDLTAYINMLWSAPMQIVLALYFLWQLLGPSVLAGVVVMIIMIPLNGVLATRMKTFQIRQMKYKDERIKLMNEVLSGMKVLKLYAWEPSFEKQVVQARGKEIDTLKSSVYLYAGTSCLWACASVLVSLATFATYVLIDENNVLDASKIFVSLSLFNILRVPLVVLPMMISSVIQTQVSVKRINKFMNSEELDPNSVEHDPQEKHPMIIKNGNFSWGDAEVTLKNINMKVPEATLCAIVGTIGSGKSSVIQAFLGEMDKLSGRVNTVGSIAYVPQQAWMQNATLRDNVLFGKPYDHNSYDRVIDACALRADIDILPAGDSTEIGEKGINLSGGQKQRISLARALYSDADLYLFDDPLSAVDSHVGKHIFEAAIGPKGMLAKKTRILVTHGITFLPQTDNIYVMKSGEISESGSYQQLLNRKGAFADFLIQHLEDGSVEAEDLDKMKQQIEDTAVSKDLVRTFERAFSVARSISVCDSVKSTESGGKINPKQRELNRLTSVISAVTKTAPKSNMAEEEVKLIPAEAIETENVQFEERRFERAISLARSVSIYESSMDLTETANKSNLVRRKLDRLQSVASTASVVSQKQKMIEEEGKLIETEKAETGSVEFAVYKYYIKSVGILLSAATLGLYFIFQLFQIGSSLWLARWSTDKRVENDTGLRNMYLGVFGTFGFIQAAISFAMNLTPNFGGLRASNILHSALLANIIRAPLSFFDTTPLGRILSRFSNDIQAVDSKIPQVISDCLWCMFGVLSTIIVISISTPTFLAAIVPIALVYYFAQRFYVPTSRQLMRLESVTRSPIYTHFSETIMGVPTIRAYNGQERFIEILDTKVEKNQICKYPSVIANRWLSIRLEMVGNSIILFASLFAVLGGQSNPGLVGLSVTYALQVTQTLNWLVRMTSDIETNIVSVERIKEYSEIQQEAAWEIENAKVPRDWPLEGRVVFENLKVRYREGLDLVLRGISFTINGSEKIGIVGRTGAGKSSLTVSLFRIIEAAGGRILIDGVDIASLGLHTLRSRLSIIPQDPVLFSGSLRMNLDPFEMKSDNEIWEALELAHLKEFVQTLPAGLNFEISEGGENLSVGQRQLVCLARALLRKTKVLVLDEATAAMDLETDDLIQKTIRTEFRNCTVLTIAHRLNTIMDSDKVIVLEKGEITEFASPAQLLKNPKSTFYSMAADANLV